MIAKASNIDGLNIFFILSTYLQFEGQVKIAKLMSHSIYLTPKVYSNCFYIYIFRVF